MIEGPYSPPTFASSMSRRRQPPSRATIAIACVAVVLIGIVLGSSIGLALGAAQGEVARPLAISEEKADIHASVHRLVGTTLGTLAGCGAGVALVGMFYWYRASVLRKLTKAPDRDAAP